VPATITFPGKQHLHQSIPLHGQVMLYLTDFPKYRFTQIWAQELWTKI